jgi:probable HAF family extracellular repeat protein
LFFELSARATNQLSPGGDFVSDALAVSMDGSIVLGYSHGAAGQRAFVWDSLHGMRDLKEFFVTEFGLGPQLAGW